jgi:hypothetical protein
VDPTSQIGKCFKDIYREAGMQGYFVGWRLRFMQYLLSTVFTVQLYAYFENQYNKSKE